MQASQTTDFEEEYVRAASALASAENQIAYLEAMIAEMRARALGWQPIETAPKNEKDGPWAMVDLWLTVHPSPRTMGWGDAFRVVDCWWEEKDGAWVHIDRGEKRALESDYITHWMLEPERPVRK